MALREKKKPKKEKRSLNFSLSGLGSKSRGKYPAKTTINLVIRDENQIDLKIAAPAIAVIILLAALFGKFMVADRLATANRASGRAQTMRTQLEAVYEKLSDYEEVEDVYAHYTYSGMTDEELERVDRVEVMRLVNDALEAGYTLKSWSVSGNVMSMQMKGSSLQELNELSRILEKEEIVDQCVITSADKLEKSEQRTDVAASFTVYLRRPEDEAAAAVDTEETIAFELETEGGEEQ